MEVYAIYCIVIMTCIAVFWSNQIELNHLSRVARVLKKHEDLLELGDEASGMAVESSSV